MTHPWRVWALLACAAVPAHAASFTARQALTGGARNPYAGLLRDEAGTLYGTSYGGGAAGQGTVFALSPPAPGQSGWTETILHSFSAAAAQDGAHPMGALIQGPGGRLYGTTSTGGGPGNAGLGTIFALDPSALPGGPWRETVLHVFPASGLEGSAPVARLLLDGAGALVGTAMAGGAGHGTVFRLTPHAAGARGWTETTLHRFGGGADGGTPLSALTVGRDGALYGTTEEGGAGLGVVYQLSAGEGTWREQVVFAFPANARYGERPDGDLISDTRGVLYGTAVGGGAHGRGTVFRLSPPSTDGAGWRCAVLYSFTGHFGDAGPEGGVVFGPGGILLGTTAAALLHQQGTVFALTPGTDAQQGWSETILARFPALPPGGGLFPVGDLAAGPDGFWGVTELGGTDGAGTVFEVKP